MASAYHVHDLLLDQIYTVETVYDIKSFCSSVVFYTIEPTLLSRMDDVACLRALACMRLIMRV